uniref:Uncharacterized protein n=1 Tax=Neogobius melanostomus TaxID=47308 RepID=A0A8C6WGN7_9GOBI
MSHGADIDHKDADGRPTLYILALENQLAITEYFLENGANVEACDTEGRTALHVSCWQGHLEMNGADPNHADQFGRTAMRVAAKGGHSMIIKLRTKSSTSSSSRAFQRKEKRDHD